MLSWFSAVKKRHFAPLSTHLPSIEKPDETPLFPLRCFEQKSARRLEISARRLEKSASTAECCPPRQYYPLKSRMHLRNVNQKKKADIYFVFPLAWRTFAYCREKCSSMQKIHHGEDNFPV